ncbi:MAG: LysE family transporter [Erysipelotrichales bacterium]
MQIFITAFTLGLAYVAPIGMQNLFVINSAITQKRSRAFLTALIIIFFDITLAVACFFGVGYIMSKSEILSMVILFVGSLIVIYIGYGIFREQAQLDNSVKVDMPITKLIFTAFVVTWANPQALIDGSMLIGSSRATLPPGSEFLFIIGFSLASFTWFMVLSGIVGFFKEKITSNILNIINKVCGIIIILYGLKLFYEFIKMMLNLF